jgi:hypothetical protein
LPEVFVAISFFLHQCFYSFFRNFFADVIRQQLAARIPDKPLLHPPVLFPGLEDDSSYTQRGPQGGCLSLDTSGFVFLQSHFLFLLFFCKCHHCFFTPTMIFAILSFLLIFTFPLSLFIIYLQLKSITDTCYGAPVGSLIVLPLPRFGPAQDADVEEGLTEVGAAQPAAGPRAPLAAAASTFAVGASASTAAAGATAATSAPGPSTFHDPGGNGPHSSSPPVYYEYPSLCTAFS